MKKLTRLPLNQRALNTLQKRTQKVIADPNPSAKAVSLWDNRGSAADAHIKETLNKMASGLSRCMYCEDSAATAVEHFWPKSKYPCLAFIWENYLLVCSACNSEKSDQFPLQSGLPLLIDPTQDDPRNHLLYLPITGAFSQRDSKGDHTIKIIKLNRVSLLRGRRNTFTKLQLLIVAYNQAKTQNNSQHISKYERTIREEPFGCMLGWLLQISQGRLAKSYIDPACLQSLQQCPEIQTWV